jgi:hypothetical protein
MEEEKIKKYFSEIFPDKSKLKNFLEEVELAINLLKKTSFLKDCCFIFNIEDVLYQFLIFKEDGKIFAQCLIKGIGGRDLIDLASRVSNELEKYKNIKAVEEDLEFGRTMKELLKSKRMRLW